MRAGLQAGQVGAEHQAVLAALDLDRADGLADAFGRYRLDRHAEGFGLQAHGRATGEGCDDPLFHGKTPVR